ncbi:MAG: hypothetical protein M0Q92_09115 [Methanoregula sp.]|jgi:hypothetical protein|nr:hypothetical protein [Methanoregula sp.]
MDKLSAALCATSVAYFWFLIYMLLVAVAAPNLTDLVLFSVMAIIGVISLAGIYLVICQIKGRSTYWYLGIPLAVMFAGGILSALEFILIAINSPIFQELGVPGIFGPWIVFVLFGLAPGAFLLFIALSPLVKNRVFLWISLVIIGIISVYPVMSSLDSLCVILHVIPSSSFSTPLSSTILDLYNRMGFLCMGILLILLAYQVREANPPTEAPALDNIQE